MYESNFQEIGLLCNLHDKQSVKLPTTSFWKWLLAWVSKWGVVVSLDEPSWLQYTGLTHKLGWGRSEQQSDSLKHQMVALLDLLSVLCDIYCLSNAETMIWTVRTLNTKNIKIIHAVHCALCIMLWRPLNKTKAFCVWILSVDMNFKMKWIHYKWWSQVYFWNYSSFIHSTVIFFGVVSCSTRSTYFEKRKIAPWFQGTKTEKLVIKHPSIF